MPSANRSEDEIPLTFKDNTSDDLEQAVLTIEKMENVKPFDLAFPFLAGEQKP
jgi:hypothetical protein